MGEAFSLQDQHGLYKDLLSTKGWINDASGGAHMEYTTDPKHAGKFTGIPTCAGGECALQLHGSPGGGALSYACPMPGPGLTLYGNPKVGQKLRFSEVSCDVPLFISLYTKHPVLQILCAEFLAHISLRRLYITSSLDNQETYSEHNMDSFDLEYMILSPSSQYDGGEEEASIPLDQDSWRPNTYCVIS